MDVIRRRIRTCHITRLPFNIVYQISNPFDSNSDDEFVSKLEIHAVQKSEETTQEVNECLKIAENIREDATGTQSPCMNKYRPNWERNYSVQRSDEKNSPDCEFFPSGFRTE
ncbi:SNAP25 likeous protein SNAP33 [Dendrobium catenatum]|uniref:SNAP25 likeous protein SNAP33 n=1 Tax=Dendrobium catenatum TaxID=906689 RepID=A0A2I0W8T2_9ASPA|nr:SNAP25 likeous protein SNAP33 [Dendrobium catenatum]